MLRVEVNDTGAGMTPDQLKNMFKEGVQFDVNALQAGHGSGLGLVRILVLFVSFLLDAVCRACLLPVPSFFLKFSFTLFPHRPVHCQRYLGATRWRFEGVVGW